MNDLFVPFELALKLREKKFPDEGMFAEWQQWDGGNPYIFKFQDWNEEMGSDYTVECYAPMYQQVVSWLREQHNIHIHLRAAYSQKLYKFDGKGIRGYEWSVFDFKTGESAWTLQSDYNTALSAAIRYVLNSLTT